MSAAWVAISSGWYHAVVVTGSSRQDAISRCVAELRRREAGERPGATIITDLLAGLDDDEVADNHVAAYGPLVNGVYGE